MGIAAEGIKLSKTLNTFVGQVRFAEKEIKGIATDVESTSIVLKQYGENLKLESESMICSFEFFQNTTRALNACAMCFKDIDTLLKESATVVENEGVDGTVKYTMKTKNRIRWPWQQSKVAVLRSDLDRQKANLLLMLEVMKHARDRHEEAMNQREKVVSQRIEQLTVEALELKTEEAERRYETLRRRAEMAKDQQQWRNTSAPKDDPNSQAHDAEDEVEGTEHNVDDRQPIAEGPIVGSYNMSSTTLAESVQPRRNGNRDPEDENHPPQVKENTIGGGKDEDRLNPPAESRASTDRASSPMSWSKIEMFLDRIAIAQEQLACTTGVDSYPYSSVGDDEAVSDDPLSEFEDEKEARDGDSMTTSSRPRSIISARTLRTRRRVRFRGAPTNSQTSSLNVNVPHVYASSNPSTMAAAAPDLNVVPIVDGLDTTSDSRRASDPGQSRSDETMLDTRESPDTSTSPVREATISKPSEFTLTPLSGALIRLKPSSIMDDSRVSGYRHGVRRTESISSMRSFTHSPTVDALAVERYPRSMTSQFSSRNDIQAMDEQLKAADRRRLEKGKFKMIESAPFNLESSLAQGGHSIVAQAVQVLSHDNPESSMSRGTMNLPADVLPDKVDEEAQAVVGSDIMALPPNLTGGEPLAKAKAELEVAQKAARRAQKKLDKAKQNAEEALGRVNDANQINDGVAEQVDPPKNETKVSAASSGYVSPRAESVAEDVPEDEIIEVTEEHSPGLSNFRARRRRERREEARRQASPRSDTYTLSSSEAAKKKKARSGWLKIIFKRRSKKRRGSAGSFRFSDDGTDVIVTRRKETFTHRVGRWLGFTRRKPDDESVYSYSGSGYTSASSDDRIVRRKERPNLTSRNLKAKDRSVSRSEKSEERPWSRVKPSERKDSKPFEPPSIPPPAPPERDRLRVEDRRGPIRVASYERLPGRDVMRPPPPDVIDLWYPYFTPGAANNPAGVLAMMEAWVLRRAEPDTNDHLKSWRRVTRVLLPITIEEMEEVVKQAKKGKKLWEQFSSLSTFQQRQIDRLLAEKRAQDTDERFEWILVALKTDPKKVKGPPDTVSIQFIIQRKVRVGTTSMFSNLPGPPPIRANSSQSHPSGQPSTGPGPPGARMTRFDTNPTIMNAQLPPMPPPPPPNIVPVPPLPYSSSAPEYGAPPKHAYPSAMKESSKKQMELEAKQKEEKEQKERARENEVIIERRTTPYVPHMMDFKDSSYSDSRYEPESSYSGRKKKKPSRDPADDWLLSSDSDTMDSDISDHYSRRSRSRSARRTDASTATIELPRRDFDRRVKSVSDMALERDLREADRRSVVLERELQVRRDPVSSRSRHYSDMVGYRERPPRMDLSEYRPPLSRRRSPSRYGRDSRTRPGSFYDDSYLGPLVERPPPLSNSSNHYVADPYGPGSFPNSIDRYDPYHLHSQPGTIGAHPQYGESSGYVAYPGPGYGPGPQYPPASNAPSYPPNPFTPQYSGYVVPPSDGRLPSQTGYYPPPPPPAHAPAPVPAPSQSPPKADSTPSGPAGQSSTQPPAPESRTETPAVSGLYYSTAGAPLRQNNVPPFAFGAPAQESSLDRLLRRWTTIDTDLPKGDNLTNGMTQPLPPPQPASRQNSDPERFRSPPRQNSDSRNIPSALPSANAPIRSDTRASHHSFPATLSPVAEAPEIGSTRAGARMTGSPEIMPTRSQSDGDRSVQPD